MKEKIIKLENSISLFVRDTENDKVPLLLLHFGSGNSYIWDGIIPGFKDSFRIIAPDFRGHGRSDKPKKGYHIDNLAEDIYLLLKELGVDSCHIIGSSLGAEVGASFTASHPQMVRSLVCEGALYNEFGEYGLFNGTREEIAEEKKRRLAARLDKKEELFESKKALLEEKKEAFQEAGLWNEYFQKYVENNVCQREEGKFSTCYPLYVANEYLRQYWEFTFEEYYQKIDCPVLFLPSADEWKDDKINRIIHRFADLLEDCQIKLIKGSQHAYLWMQFPEIAGKIAYNFINEVEVKGGFD